MTADIKIISFLWRKTPVMQCYVIQHHVVSLMRITKMDTADFVCVFVCVCMFLKTLTKEDVMNLRGIRSWKEVERGSNGMNTWFM